MPYLNQDANTKKFKAQRYYLPEVVIKKYTVIIDGKNFHEQPTDSDIKWYKEKRKLITGKGENYTTGCLLDSEIIVV